MANFLRAVFKHLAAIVVAFALFCFLGFLVLVAIGTLFQPKPVKVPQDAVLVFDLGVQIYDSPGNTSPLDEVFSGIGGNAVPSLPLRQVLHALETAKNDDSIAGILLMGNLGAGGSMANTFATLTEVREKLAEVEASGKPVFAYSVTDGLGELYLKSVASEHWMDPVGLLDYRGLAAQIPYLGGVFDKAGVHYQVIRAGKYKSAAEPYSSREMSSETRESLQALLDDLWLELRKGVAGGTGISLEDLDQLASDRPMIMSRDARELGLIDELLHYDEMQEKLIEFAGYASHHESFTQIAMQDYLAATKDPLAALGQVRGDQVAVVYAEGTIVDGEGTAKTVGGDRFARILRQLRRDDAVKAVVLRVNSPGGSATASEVLSREIQLTNEKKPVVVSMGGYAASGGYYIAAHGETIFAHPTTITGSIGVIAMIPNVEELAGTLDVNIETVQTNRNGALWSLFQPRNEEQLALLDERVDYTYDLFLNRVSAGRSMTVEAVDLIAQGREWSGLRALDHHLVDRFGGLESAIQHAADLGGLGDRYTITDYPRAMTVEEVIGEIFAGGGGGFGARSAFPFEALESQVGPLIEELQWWFRMNDPHHVYSYAPARLQW